MISYDLIRYDIIQTIEYKYDFDHTPNLYMVPKLYWLNSN